ncbi:hypothetical protein B0H13DRAFT_2331471 [Mycena leptocephala]|nr:hypothetical protein B0H13DRAFT_2331471 [Mycena leptocephala]
MPSLAALRDLRRLCIGAEALRDAPNTLLHKVTHLELLRTYNSNTRDLMAPLGIIPHLTHVAFHGALPNTVLLRALCADARLQCIVFFREPISVVLLQFPSMLMFDVLAASLQIYRTYDCNTYASLPPLLFKVLSTLPFLYRKLHPAPNDNITNTSTGQPGLTGRIEIFGIVVELFYDSGFPDLWQLLPFSRGNVKITSADPFTAPAIRANYFSVWLDLDVQVAGARLSRRILTSPPLNSLSVGETTPGSKTRQAAGKTRIKNGFASVTHPIGTAAMVRRSLGGVVDAQL